MEIPLQRAKGDMNKVFDICMKSAMSCHETMSANRREIRRILGKVSDLHQSSSASIMRVLQLGSELEAQYLKIKDNINFREILEKICDGNTPSFLSGMEIDLDAVRKTKETLDKLDKNLIVRQKSVQKSGSAPVSLRELSLDSKVKEKQNRSGYAPSILKSRNSSSN